MLLAILVVLITCGVGVFIDYLCHARWYSTEAFQSLQGRVERATAHLEDIKSRPGRDRPSRIRDIKSLEDALDTERKILMGATMRATLLTAGSNFALFFLMRMLFSGVVVATLPFEPIAWFKAMALAQPQLHPRGASWLFFYVLSNASLKPFISKMLRIEAPKATGGQAVDWSKIMAGAGGEASRGRSD